MGGIRRTARAAVVVAAVATGGVLVAPAPPAVPAPPSQFPDFDGDGNADLAVGLPLADVGGVDGAGQIHVLYGSGSGLTAAGDEIFHRDTSGVAGSPGTQDWFGAEVAAGDFDGDGYADLAVGVPYDDVSGTSNAGRVHVFYGGPSGLGTTGAQMWSRDSASVTGGLNNNAFFGWGVVAGDFDGDGRDDLAVGAPNANVGSTPFAGAVNVLYGSGSGLTAAGDDLFHRDSPGVPGAPATGDGFGWALAAGRLDHGGRDDLVIGTPFAADGGPGGAGSATVLFGTGSGLSGTGAQLWHRGVAGVAGVRAAGDWFGLSVAVGDLDGDGHDDVVVGVPFDDVGAAVDAGAVNVLYGSASGPGVAGDQLWHREVAGVNGAAATGTGVGQSFGFNVAPRDFDGDGRADLLTGVPGDDVNGVTDAGAVNVLYGASGGLTAAGDRMFHRATSGIPGAPEMTARFGHTVGGASFDGNVRAEGIIGSPWATVDGVPGAGTIFVLRGTPNGLVATEVEIWNRDRAGVAGVPDDNAAFGAALVGASIRF